MKDQVLEVIYNSIEDVKDSLTSYQEINKTKETALIGNEGFLDSLGLVVLIVAVEQNLQETLGISPTLADEKAMSQKVSPFRTIETLADYIIKLTGKV